MRELLSKIRKRRVWGIGAFVLFTLLFLSFFALKEGGIIKAAPGDPDEPLKGVIFQDEEGNQVASGGRLIMRRADEEFLILGLPGNATVEWVSQNTNVVSVDPATKNSHQAKINVETMSGNAAVNVNYSYTDSDGKLVTETATVTIEVVFSIQEYLNITGVSMGKVYESDERRSMIMEMDSQVPIGNQNDGSDHIKLVFGDGTLPQATWESSNKDIINIAPATADRPKQMIQAVGAGPARLTVTYVDGTRTYTDTIDVYVKPKLTDKNGKVLAGGIGGSASGSVVVENHERIGVSVRAVDHPELAAGDKLVWVISKGEGDQEVLVRDSLGNIGTDADEAKLVYIPKDPADENSTPAYRVDAKAGVYNVYFYVKGTYTNFADSKDPDKKSNVDSVTLQTSVKCDFTDKDIVLNLGSSYALSEAFNIPVGVLTGHFTYDILADGNQYIGCTWDKAATIWTKALGTAQVRIRPSDIQTINVPGLTDNPVTVTVTVADTFALNRSEVTMAVGSTLDLYGVIGSNTDVDSSRFEWSISNDIYATLSNTTGRYVTVTATQKTPVNEPVIVSLAWTEESGITRVAQCSITINESATDFKITPETVNLEVGSSEYLQTNLTGSKNILWISSDTSIVTVEPQTGNIAAKITATEKTGNVVITAINRDNDTYATALVTVTAPITDIKIDKGPAYTTSIGTPFVFLEAIYQPANATQTEMIWESSDESIATVDANGMVTVLKLGQTTITVKPAYNPNGVFAQCILTVKDEPITGIQTDVKTLNMKVGDTYDVKVTLTPENPTDRTLTWTTSKADVATVSNGTITAVGVGTATIMVQGGNASPVMIEVNVRQRLESFAFETTSMELEVNQTKKLNIIFTPSEGVNTNVTFYSSDESTVTVDKDGNLTGISVGSALITCIAEDLGEYRPITCKVTVIQQHLVATDFTIDPLEQTIQVGDDFTILPIFTPAETTNKQVRYQSLDEAIATVTEEGVVTGVMAGQTVIQCTAVETNLTALCKVTVENAITFSLNPSSREIAIGKSFKISKVTKPSNVDKAATWRTSNSKIASISATGKVTGKKIGTCTITCTLKKYKQSATCRVKVAKLKSTLKLDKSSIRMNVGSTYRLKKTVWSNNSSNPSVKYTSRNKRIATVGSSSGKITAKRVGSTVITAKTTDAVHATARCRVTVIHRATSISLNKTYAICHIGNTIKLKANLKPSNVSIKKVKWSTSDDKIASVTGTGKITGYAEGEVYITATTTDGSNKSAKCLVRVMEPIPATNIMVAQQKLTMKRGDTAKLSYTILPDNQTDTIKMASDNKSVATVTNAGKVKAVGTGIATITITSSSGTTATVEVNVVELNKSSLRMRQLDTETLRVIGTTDPITWYSANNRIATVANGLVVGKGMGTTYIYAYVNGCKMACKVEIVSVNSK
jgi:uncharacterized protein YjdB